MGEGRGGAGVSGAVSSRSVDLSVIVINWNTADYLAGCLDSLQQCHLDGLKAEVWVIDNASSDGSADLVRTRYPWARLQANARNLGFAAANNAVMRQARGRVFFLLNADMVVPAGTTAELFGRMAAASDVGVVSCRQVDSQGNSLESYMFDYMDGRIPGAVEPRSQPREDGDGLEVAWVWGSGMMVRREVFERLGGFDESFFMYYEDLEWCWRIRRAGWKIVCYPDLHVTHFVRRSTSRVPAQTTAIRLVAGELALFQRHMSPRRFRRFIIGRFLYSLRGVVFYRLMLALAPCEKYRTKHLRYTVNAKAMIARSPALRRLRLRWWRVVDRLKRRGAAPARGASARRD